MSTRHVHASIVFNICADIKCKDGDEEKAVERIIKRIGESITKNADASGTGPTVIDLPSNFDIRGFGVEAMIVDENGEPVDDEAVDTSALH